MPSVLDDLFAFKPLPRTYHKKMITYNEAPRRSKEFHLISEDVMVLDPATTTLPATQEHEMTEKPLAPSTRN
ncbi:unnamed protein product [Ilex paraguariensis]|uniref:Uncharacterized protein n=1 Tax=Ilex paraguariensis TaxID=185542 RepID=A0ABC8UKQ8_9AQUA